MVSLNNKEMKSKAVHTQMSVSGHIVLLCGVDAS
jgi:hypothetical protein